MTEAVFIVHGLLPASFFAVRNDGYIRISWRFQRFGNSLSDDFYVSKLLGSHFRTIFMFPTFWEVTFGRFLRFQRFGKLLSDDFYVSNVLGNLYYLYAHKSINLILVLHNQIINRIFAAQKVIKF
jgi:hypothetical protein